MQGSLCTLKLQSARSENPGGHAVITPSDWARHMRKKSAAAMGRSVWLPDSHTSSLFPD